MTRTRFSRHGTRERLEKGLPPNDSNGLIVIAVRVGRKHGLPVLVINDVAYGPLDMVKVDGKSIVAGDQLTERVSRFMSQAYQGEGDGNHT